MWLKENKDHLRTIIFKILVAKRNKPDWNERREVNTGGHKKCNYITRRAENKDEVWGNKKTKYKQTTCKSTEQLPIFLCLQRPGFRTELSFLQVWEAEEKKYE